MSGRVRLGELLVTGQIISREQLEQVLALQQTDGRRLGKLLVERGLVTETQLTQILSQQLAVPWVSLYHIDFSRQLLDLVPQELAERYCLVPIFVRRVRGLGETLYVAMDDPTDEPAVRAVSEFAALPVRTMIAPPSDIRSAIRAYYSGSTAPGADSEFPVEVGGTEPPSRPRPEPDENTPTSPSVVELDVSDVATAVPEQIATAVPATVAAVVPAPVVTGVKPAKPPFVAQPTPAPFEAVVVPKPAIPPKPDDAPSVPPPSDSPTIEAREVSMPAPPRRPARRMVTLTFLDGTRVNLPARSAPPPGAAEEAATPLTARDLITALRAVSHGADAREILGDKPRWEPFFAALLELLLKKHLIADWEFVEAFNKINAASVPPKK
jgi:type IV pilus assembly protein PilB